MRSGSSDELPSIQRWSLADLSGALADRRAAAGRAGRRAAAGRSAGESWRDGLVADIAGASDLPVGRLQPGRGLRRARRSAVCREDHLDRDDQGRLLPGRRRHQFAAGGADDRDGADRDAGLVQCRGARQDALCPAVPAGSGNAGLFRGAEFLLLLYLLGIQPGAGVLHYSELGPRPREPAPLRRLQVLRLYDGWLGWLVAAVPVLLRSDSRGRRGDLRPGDAGAARPGPAGRRRPGNPTGYHLPLCGPSRHYKLPRAVPATIYLDRVLGDLHRLRNQAGGVAIPHLAARRLRRGADGRLDSALGGDVEDGRVWHAADHAAAGARSRAV